MRERGRKKTKSPSDARSSTKGKNIAEGGKKEDRIKTAQLNPRKKE